nr:hypothetical protein [Burkholderiales bacterium]
MSSTPVPAAPSAIEAVAAAGSRRPSGAYARDFADLSRRIEHCFGPERGRLIGRLAKLREAGERASADDIAQLRTAIDTSAARVAARRARVPTITYPEDLPVSERRADLAAAITAHPVVIVCGETGSGKTTQLPKLCLELGRGVTGAIGHTQPRRVAARSVATRIAQELQSTPGDLVGWKVRFNEVSQ